MKSKDKIRNEPYKVIKTAQRHDNNFTLYIEIELVNQKDNLYLLLSHEKGMHIGDDPTIHRYDDNGKRFFNDLMENFGRAWIKIPEGKSIEFDNYEALLNKITSD
jgi:hypothetical protein